LSILLPHESSRYIRYPPSTVIIIIIIIIITTTINDSNAGRLLS
jgi:hypothetical protein